MIDDPFVVAQSALSLAAAVFLVTRVARLRRQRLRALEEEIVFLHSKVDALYRAGRGFLEDADVARREAEHYRQLAEMPPLVASDQCKALLGAAARSTPIVEEEERAELPVARVVRSGRVPPSS